MPRLARFRGIAGRVRPADSPWAQVLDPWPGLTTAGPDVSHLTPPQSPSLFSRIHAVGPRLPSRHSNQMVERVIPNPPSSQPRQTGALGITRPTSTAGLRLSAHGFRPGPSLRQFPAIADSGKKISVMTIQSDVGRDRRIPPIHRRRRGMAAEAGALAATPPYNAAPRSPQNRARKSPQLHGVRLRNAGGHVSHSPGLRQ
jgi:hypothetical protein